MITGSSDSTSPRAVRFRLADLFNGIAPALGGESSGNHHVPVVAAVPADPRSPVEQIARTLARGLAAQVGLRLLLIDARLEFPANATSSEAGFCRALQEPGATLAALAQPIDAGVDYIPRGAGTAPNAITVLERLVQLVPALRGLYDEVILLTDPVTVSITARFLARAAHRTLVLAREDETLMHELEETREILLDNQVAKIAIVFEKPVIDWRERLFGPPQALLERARRQWRQVVAYMRQRQERIREKAAKSPAGAAKKAPRPRAYET